VTDLLSAIFVAFNLFQKC